MCVQHSLQIGHSDYTHISIRFYDKEFDKGKNTVTVSFRSWQVKADSIRKLNRARKDQVTESVPANAQPGEVPF
jgi:hypothetical protein